MPDIFDESPGEVTIPLDSYLKLRQRAFKNVDREKHAEELQEKLNKAARELEQFLGFLYKNVEFNFVEYVNVFNQKAEGGQIILNDKDRKVKIKLEGYE